MPRKNPTSVVFSKKAEELKDRWSLSFGLKGILSVGLELFDALSDKEKIRRVADVNKEENNSPADSISGETNSVPLATFLETKKRLKLSEEVVEKILKDNSIPEKTRQNLSLLKQNLEEAVRQDKVSRRAKPVKPA